MPQVKRQRGDPATLTLFSKDLPGAYCFRRKCFMLEFMSNRFALCRRANWLAALAVSAVSASADEPRPSPLPKPPPVSMQAYGDHNADCLEWTNSCLTCRREEDAEIACSTPGIACQPGEISCAVKRKK
jgi:hypothetical protein